ncbi:hypothetical protein [Thioalkalivibrio sp. AKL6]|uniref:hypothetical protein n=1 Tax=Thioalkalivibrio sp. AKL6 TaxID=1158154 RepID=UPI0012DCA3B7|nr:hypothetical protein [Thioalkalivibrio sp. AKL6]
MFRSPLKTAFQMMSLMGTFGLLKLFRLTRSAVVGLSQIFEVINRGEFSDYQIRDLKTRHGMTFEKLSRKSMRARLVEKVLNTSPGSYQHSVGQVLYFGGSWNNEREFYFFSDVVADGAPLFLYSRENNLAFFERAPLTTSPVLEGLKKILLLATVAFSYRLEANAGTVTHLVLFLKTFVRMLMYFEQDVNRLPRLAVVANDHSVTAVAFFSVMQFFRVPTVYLQHAEVSHAFPALRFDHNILRNIHSLDVYRSIGKIRGKVYVIPRDPKLVDYAALDQEIDEPVLVGVYLTSIVDRHGVRETVQALRSNPSVGGIFIKPHPRTGIDNLPKLSGVDVVDEVPDTPHVAVVGNSSIVVEILRSGNRVYNLFRLDEVDKDYYGFVGNRLVPEVSLTDIRGRFWLGAYMGPGWRESIEYYAPSPGPDIEKEISRLKNDIARYVA